MFLKTLTIFTPEGIIREMVFQKGINLIVDETPKSDQKATGNNVGKTTVLKLIDFCLGASPTIIYVDPESKRDVYSLVKEFLIDNKVIIRLVLKEDLENENSTEIVVERNFLSRNQAIRRINNRQILDEEFENRLLQLMFPNHLADKPTFRQIISHNIRYRDEVINNTLKTLDRYTSDVEYETLYLFLLGCEYHQGNLKQQVLLKLNQEETFKQKLERRQTKTAYETTLSLVNNRINELDKRKSNLNINEKFKDDLDKLNELQYYIMKIGSRISTLKIRRDLIIETETELKNSTANIDLYQLKMIYDQAVDTIRMENINKKFEELVQYHNRMIDEKRKYVIAELPKLQLEIQRVESDLAKSLEDKGKLAKKLSQSDSYEELEKTIAELNEEYRKKGEFESILQQINDSDKIIGDLNNQLDEINKELFSDDFELIVKKQVNKFNEFFASISSKLYGEQYALKYDLVTNKKGQKLYKFSAFNTNFSSGKKQGEISCFDIAYVLFADSEKIPCLHFILNDKKELMHDNQLVEIAKFVKENNIQFVASILKDKLPDELNKEKYFVVKLSQTNKLFRIEENLKSNIHNQINDENSRRMNPSNPSMEALIERIQKGISALEIGERFSIPDFFDRTEWEQHEKGTRLNVGKKFKKMVDDSEVQGVVFVGTTSDNLAVYCKTN